MHRISITYPSAPGASFDWDYYMTRHLPLAVGTSMRHSGLNFCDADRPLNDNTPHACVCMVHFDNEASMNSFCNIFVSGHPDSEKIGEDEINYTTINPGMTAGEYEVSGASVARSRVKLFFPWKGEMTAEREEIREAQAGILVEAGMADKAVLSTETDYCRSGLAPGSTPEYSLIWTLNFADTDRATDFALDCSPLRDLLRAEEQIMVSEIVPFDLELTRPYRKDHR